METRSESGVGLWSASGLWHLSSATCEVNQHTGTTGWYYGEDAMCDYADPNAPISAGSLDLPEVPALPADARIAYWSRRQADPRAGFDTSKVQISTAGTSSPYTDLQSVTDNTGIWRYAGVTNIFTSGGATADLRFRFDTVDGAANNFLGWMVDDVQVTGCNAAGAGTSSARAEAYAASASICSSSGGLVDAAGSFCGDSGVPSSFQWKENGSDIPGASSVAYAIPTGKPIGAYNYSVSIGCPGGASDLSAPAPVSVVTGTPGAVGDTLTLDDTPGFTSLMFHWSDIPLAADYVVLESTTKNGAFTTVTGTAASGATGLTVPMPQGAVVYYLVAGRGPCGLGPAK
jgi:hypothetical protein